jgi:hypothetical protein
MSEQKSEIEIRLFKLLFAVRRSIRYHNYRRLFFERWSVVSDFLIIVSGGTVVGLASAGTTTVNPSTLFFGAFIAIVGSLDLVIGFSNKARDYRDLARDFVQLEIQMMEAGDNPDEKTLAALFNKRLEIEQNEPPILRVLDCYCHNEMVRITDYKTRGEAEGEKVKITLFQTFFMPLFDWWPSTLKKNRDTDDWINPDNTDGVAVVQQPSAIHA